MFLDLLRGLAGAAVAAVLPGYFWAGFLRPAGGLAERLAYSTALSMASVPPLALALARGAGTGVTLWMALVSVGLVFVSGLLAVVMRGPAPGTAPPVLPRPPAIRDGRVLALIAAAFALVLALLEYMPVPGWELIVTAVALVAGGMLAARQAGHAPAAEPPGGLPSAVRAPTLAIVLGLTAFRAYFGVIRHDWPFLRGGDQFSHAVMAEQMLSHGSYGSYLVYPPGFSTLTAVVCRLAGLPPLLIFPVLAPALLVVTALGAYALATRLWGWEYGVLAAALSGIVLVGSYASFADGRYPDLIDAYFLMVMTVAALLTLYQSPSLRSGLLLTVVGASVVLYHSVATVYLAALLALIALIGLPYLLLHRRRRDACALLLALVALVVLGVCYAWVSYGLPRFLGGGSATATAVSAALGSQNALSPSHLLSALTPAVVWLGALGTAMLVMTIRYLRAPPQVLAAMTMLAWCGLMYAGSRTAVDGFPQRFEQDLGGPLSVIGALALGVLVTSLPHWRVPGRAATALTSVAAVGLVSAVAAERTIRAMGYEAGPAGVISSPVWAAGQWLAWHNSGSGTIISTPYMNDRISNRAMLAMGGYTGLQSYTPSRIRNPRSLPPGGRWPLLDSQEVLLHPASCRAANVLARDNVQYVVLYKPRVADLAAFRADHARYRRVFSNASVVIYAPARVALGSTPACATPPTSLRARADAVP